MKPISHGRQGNGVSRMAHPNVATKGKAGAYAQNAKVKNWAPSADDMSQGYTRVSGVFPDSNAGREQGHNFYNRTQAFSEKAAKRINRGGV
jgi:hypothetical protein